MSDQWTAHRSFAIEGEEKLLHRLEQPSRFTPCGLFGDVLSPAISDGLVLAQWDKCAPCWIDAKFTDKHTSHCCVSHFCKYQSEWCTVKRGVAPQEHPCEFCEHDAEEMADRGEVWQYGIVSEYGPENDFDVLAGHGIHLLTPGKPAPKLREGIKVVRRRVSQWEVYEK